MSTCEMSAPPARRRVMKYIACVGRRDLAHSVPLML